jgi:Kdo2-lipid IVA lauroyltransferase/acyltransferase
MLIFYMSSNSLWLGGKKRLPRSPGGGQNRVTFTFIYERVLYRLSEVVFFFLYGLVKILPPSLFPKIAYPFLHLFIYFVVPRKRIIRNLTAAFGKSYSDSTKKGVARGIQEHFIRNLVDCFLQFSRSTHAREIIDVLGMEHLDSALRKGKGVIALGAHIGNFVLLGTRIGSEGYKFHTLFRIPPDPRIHTLISRFLPAYRYSVIPSSPRRTAVRKILEALKKNEIVYILGDNLRKGNVDALLFGQRVPSPRGPVSLALRSGAPLVPMYLVRNYQGSMQLVIEPELEMARNGSLAESITDNTRRVVGYLESLIRRYPDQWNWLTIRLKIHRFDFLDQPTREESVPMNQPRKNKDGADEGRTPDLMLGKHGLKKKPA